MFFRHVVGKVQLHPYLHIVTWSLPKRYVGLLKIFNLPLEEYPHQLITQYSETLNSYELQVTKKSISPLQSKISTEDLGKPRENPTENVESEPATSSDSKPTRKKRKISKNKPVISIRVKLDDELKNLKRTNGKNFERILSKCSRRSCLLVLEKSKSSKREEYSLKFVNNTNLSKTYSKLLRKNRRKRDSFVTATNTKPNKSLSSEFSEENIHPIWKMNETFFSEHPQRPLMNKLSQYQEFNTKTMQFSRGREDKKEKFESEESKTNQIKEDKITEKESKTGHINRNTALAIPSHLVPYEKPIQEEPLRHWPVITQLFDGKHIEIYKNYLKSLNTPDEEKEETQENDQEPDNIVAIDISQAKSFHENLTSSSIYRSGKTTKIGSLETKTANVEQPQEESESYKSSNVSTTDLPTKKNNFVKPSGNKKSNVIFLNETSQTPTNYSVINEKCTDTNDGVQKLYTSTAYLVIGETYEKSKNRTTPNDERNTINTSRSESLINTRLLSSSMKSYKSITENEDTKQILNIEKERDEELCKKQDEKTRNSEKKLRGLRKLYFFNIVLAVFVAVVLGIILFISFADNSTVNGFVEKYIKS
ncbi:uncharacterized protein LOC123318405 [Coccinella septempunctata]|uniref:uncharacterized protein LOC123318405 n=1 Tax=Coccinella septempunctata TaxID=41139 RepID=UPI001D093732|nr:uncharacterized protein LOC123318405 [Coccinella septempunctata]